MALEETTLADVFWLYGEPNFTPAQLFDRAAPGVWYDPSDMSTLFQDSLGTTPVTALEQPVGLILDKSQGVLNSNRFDVDVASLVATINNAGSATSVWTAPSWTVSVASSLTGYPRLSVNLPGVTSGKTYRISGTIALTGTFTTVTLRLALSGSSNNIAAGVSSSFSGVAIAAASDVLDIFPAGSPTGTLTFLNLSIQELPGNHAIQATSASRPVLSARYNLLTMTEDFTGSPWSRTGVAVTPDAITAPNGATTADRIIMSTGTDLKRVSVNATTVVGKKYYQSVYIKPDEIITHCFRYSSTERVNFDFTAKTATVTGTLYSEARLTELSNGWFFLIAAFTADSTTTLLFFGPSNANTTGNDINGYYMWGTSFLSENDFNATGGAYQRVGAATDYATGATWKPYLAFDGVDDSLATSGSVNFSTTDNVSVFAGVTRLSDAVSGFVVELTNGTPINRFLLRFIAISTIPNYRFASGGTAIPTVDVVTSAAPDTKLVTGLGKISTDFSSIRTNGVPGNTTTFNQGTGNYANDILYIGRRAGTTDALNGRIYSLIAVGILSSDKQVMLTEKFVADKMGLKL